MTKGLVKESSLPTLWFSGYGGQSAAFIDAAAEVSWQASLVGDWLQFSGASSGTGPGLVSLCAGPSTVPEQSGELHVSASGWAKSRIWPVRQASMSALSALSDSVVQTPFATVPKVMEFGIAAKFIGQQIKKIPEPFDLVALVIAELAVVAAGILLITARLGFSTVPEPKTWFPAPEGDPLGSTFDAFRQLMPVTSVNLSLETELTAICLALQALGE